jgi:putative membrane protein
LSTADTNGWRRTSPLAIVFYIGKTLQLIARNAVQSLAPLVALLFAYQGDIASKLMFAAIAFATFVLAAAILRYLFFRYRVTANAVIIREGVFRKRQLDIKFDRIQAINTEQNIVNRPFRLVTVKFDTAGSAGEEGFLPAISQDLADAIRETIRRKKPGVLAEDDAADAPQDSEIREILTLTNADMIRIGLSDNRALIFLAFLGPLFEQAEDYVESIIDENTVVAMLATEIGIAQGASLALLLTAGILLALAFASIIGAFLRYHGYTLVQSDDVFQSTGGLLTRHVHSINRSKIQMLYTTQNVMLRMFGRFRVNARQASSRKNRGKKNFAVPVCRPELLAELCGDFFGGEFSGLASDPKSAAYSSIAVQYLRSRMLLAAVAPACLMVVLLSPALGWESLWLLSWIPVGTLAVWHRYRRYGVQVTNNGLALRKGFLGYRISSFLHRKVQRIGVTQTVFQRRKGLATMRFYLASGVVKVPNVDARQSMTLRDHVLYRIESSQLAWH